MPLPEIVGFRDRKGFVESDEWQGGDSIKTGVRALWCVPVYEFRPGTKKRNHGSLIDAG